MAIRNMRKLLPVVFAIPLLFTGCLSIDQFYTPNRFASEIEVLDYEGPLKAEQVVGMSFDQLLDLRAAEDYILIGTANFTGQGNVDWTVAMESLGRRLKAEKIDFHTQYLGTEQNTRVLAVPTVYNSTATVWGPNGPRTVNVSTTGMNTMPYTYSVPRNAFSVCYFKKLKNKYPFGMSFGAPNEDVAKELGTRSAVVIARVVPGKIAWKNDLFKGDIILEVDGKKATQDNVIAFCKDSNGKKMKIRRGDKDFEITIHAD